MYIRFIQKLGIVSFSIYVFLAIFYYMERVSMLDSSFQLFSIVSTEDLAIQVNRYLAAFVQIFPLFSVKLNLPLELIARFYSASFPIIYGVCFFIISVIFKDGRNSTLFLVYHFLIIEHSFFWPQCELVQGVSWFLVYASFFQWQQVSLNNNLIIKLINLFCIISMVFIHPLVLLVFSFYFLTIIIADRKNQSAYWYQVGLFLLLFLAKKAFFENEYDNMFSEKLYYFFRDFYTMRKGLKISAVYERFFLNFKFLSLLLLITSIFLIYSKRYMQSIILLGYAIGLILLILICYNMNMDLFYSEVQYNLITFFIGCSLVFYIPININYLKAILVLMVLTFCYRVAAVSNIYEDRVDYVKYLIERYRGLKVIKQADKSDFENLRLVWGSSFEAWFISTTLYGQSSSILVTDNVGKFKNDMLSKDKLITEWETINYNKLNPKYFKFNDTGSYLLK